MSTNTSHRRLRRADDADPSRRNGAWQPLARRGGLTLPGLDSPKPAGADVYPFRGGETPEEQAERARRTNAVDNALDRERGVESGYHFRLYQRVRLTGEDAAARHYPARREPSEAEVKAAREAEDAANLARDAEVGERPGYYHAITNLAETRAWQDEERLAAKRAEIRLDDRDLAGTERVNLLMLANMQATLETGRLGHREAIPAPEAEERLAAWEREYAEVARRRTLRDLRVSRREFAAGRQERLRRLQEEFETLGEQQRAIEKTFEDRLRERLSAEDQHSITT